MCTHVSVYAHVYTSIVSVLATVYTHTDCGVYKHKHTLQAMLFIYNNHISCLKLLANVHEHKVNAQPKFRWIFSTKKFIAISHWRWMLHSTSSKWIKISRQCRLYFIEWFSPAPISFVDSITPLVAPAIENHNFDVILKRFICFNLCFSIFVHLAETKRWRY